MKVIVAVSCAFLLASLAGCGKPGPQSRSSEASGSQASTDAGNAGEATSGNAVNSGAADRHVDLSHVAEKHWACTDGAMEGGRPKYMEVVFTSGGQMNLTAMEPGKDATNAVAAIYVAKGHHLEFHFANLFDFATKQFTPFPGETPGPDFVGEFTHATNDEITFSGDSVKEKKKETWTCLERAKWDAETPGQHPEPRNTNLAPPNPTDPVFVLAVETAKHLLPKCKGIGEDIILMARPRIQYDDVRARQVEIAISHIPDACVTDD
jgi:hypothetical protein